VKSPGSVAADGISFIIKGVERFGAFARCNESGDVVKSSTRHSGPIAVLIAVTLLRQASAIFANDLLPLSDEFSNPATLANWLRVHEVEQWNADQLETYDINATQPGRLAMMPYTVTWFQDWRGPLSFKEITGDFVVTTDVTATGRDGLSVPQAQFSLAGLMIRTPRNITPATGPRAAKTMCFFRWARATMAVRPSSSRSRPRSIATRR